MNWCDFVVGGIIVIFGIIGIANGFILSVFKIASFFASVIISVKFYPKVAEILMNTQIYAAIKASILKNLLQQSAALAPQTDSTVKEAAAETVVEHLKLPGFLKHNIIDKLPNPTQLFDINKIMDTVSGEIAELVISILSLILLYVIVRIGLLFLKVVLKGIARLPIFKQMDKLGGLAFGAVEGLLTIYVIFAILVLFNASAAFRPFFEALDDSIVAKFLYQNNFIISWAFPGTTQ